MSKALLMIGLGLVAGIVFAEDALIYEEAASGKLEMTGGVRIIAQENGDKAFLAERTKYVVSTKTFTIDPDKSYLLSVRVKGLGDSPTVAYLGVAPHDAEGRYIDSHNVNVIGSLTELAAACEPTDTVLKIRDCSSWRKGSTVVAFDAKEDRSDLPNFNVSPSIKDIEEKDGFFEVTLVNPVGAAYQAGTKVRQHARGGFVYAKYGEVPNAWTTWEGTLKGTALRGGVTGKLVLICNLGRHNEQSMLFDQLTVKAVSE